MRCKNAVEWKGIGWQEIRPQWLMARKKKGKEKRAKRNEKRIKRKEMKKGKAGESHNNCMSISEKRIN